MRPEYFLAWRRSQGLTQMDAAKLFRVQETVISAIERGRIIPVARRADSNVNWLGSVASDSLA